MLYHVPSASKSGVLTAVGCVRAYRPRSATRCALPPLIAKIPFCVPGRPCVQPAPPTSAYNVLPMNATSATPLMNVGPLVWLDGRPEMTVVRTPSGLIFEMRDVKPPL